MTEFHNNTQKKPEENKWYNKMEDDEDDEDDVEVALPRAAPLGFRRGQAVSIGGGEGKPMAHGSILDDQPDTSEHDHIMHYGVPGCWKKVTLSSVVRGWGDVLLDYDVVFAHNCRKLKKDQRTIEALGKIGNGGKGTAIVIWHEYVVPKKVNGGQIMRQPQLQLKTSTKKGKR
jgi:hypothetical protein